MGGLFVAAAISQANLQIFQRSKTIALGDSSKRFTLRMVDKAKRGSILTADGKALARDADTYNLVVNFDKSPKSDAFFLDLANATGIPSSEFAALSASGVRTKTWLDPIPAERAAEIKALRAKWRVDGVSLGPDDLREYPLGIDAACLVGVIREQRGVDKETGKSERITVRTGLESSKNQILSGTDGVRVGLTDRTGFFLPMRMEDETVPRVDGRNIQLTIDSDLQAYASKAIQKAVEEHEALNGAALVMDPKTGDILAMANWPSFDPNGSVPSKFGYNVAYMAKLEPGSTFKILTLAKALDEGKTTMTDIINCTGGMKPTGKGRAIQCDAHGGHRAHHEINPVQAIAKSCNVCAATWALRVGRTDMVDYLNELGLLEKTNVGLPGEQQGLFRMDEYAKQLQLATLGFGQSITCTPIGLVSAFSMLANDGVRMKPRLVKKVGSEEIPIEEGRQIIGKEAANQVVSCMQAVIEEEYGTGKALRIPGYLLGGKTGTAQKVGAKSLTGKPYVSNFIGFVPAQNPKAVILVMVNEPKRGYYGATVAGPAFKEIAKGVIRHFNIPPSVPLKTEQ
jgi:cell division protein FtsI/penicillin-binding protein 2